MAKEDADKAAPIIIKKYANRRLYNTDKSTYVTLETLSQMVRDGVDFVVTDAKSGDDITRSVLTQIIFEEEAKGSSMLPTSFLRQLIQLYGDTLQGVVPGYLEASMETFTANSENMREQVHAAFGANPAIANFEAMARSNMELFENTVRMFTPFAGVPGAGSGPEDTAESASKKQATERKDVELAELKSQLEDMQAQLRDLVNKG